MKKKQVEKEKRELAKGYPDSLVGERKNPREVKRKQKQKNHRIIALVFVLIFAIYLLYTIYLLLKQPTNIMTVEEGKLYLEETDIGYIIRDEQVVKGDNYKNGMKQIKSEGEKVAKGESIFRYYSKNEEGLKKQIAELDVKIQEIMATQTNQFPADIKLLENQIDVKVEALNSLTDVSKLSEVQKEIRDLVIKKAKIAGDLSPSGSYLNQLNQQRKTLEKQLNDGTETVEAPISGIVSYKVDGLEEVLKPENFSTLSKQYLESLDLKTGKIVATNDESGKIINNFKCYIATISMAEQAKEAKVGNKLKVRLSNNAEIDAVISYISQENDEETLLILEIDKEIGELLAYRKVSFDLIWWSYSGLKVPNQAIVEQDGKHYVVRNRAGYLSKLLVKVEKQNDKYSIVGGYKPEELKELGYSNSETNSYRSVSLYDEIILNPDLEKVK